MEDGDFSDFNIRIAVVGLGLIGGSLALALRKLKPLEILGIDKDDSILEEAIRNGIIDRVCKAGDELLKQADLVIIALYPEETVEFLKENAYNFKKGAIITDTCGIKTGIIEEVNSFLPQDVDFIGGHPMAGKESKGLKAADQNLFKDANYIITPMPRNRNNNLELIKRIAKGIGCRDIIAITPQEHDRIISFTSQLPHVIAVSLMNSNVFEQNIGKFTGGSFKDATRVAAINSMLWSQLFTMNSENLIDEIERFEESIKIIKKAILSQDKNTLDNMFNNASMNIRRMKV